MLRACKIRKVFGREPSRVEAVKEASLSISPGEFVAIRGRSGSGKSTLLAMLGAMDVPTSGYVELHGENTAELSDRRRSRLRAQAMGFVFQDHYLMPHLTAAENVGLPLFYARSSRARSADVMAALEFVGLGALAARRPNQLSGGERARVAVARAIVGRPKYILADEPTGNLDSANASMLFGMFRRFREQGAAVIVVSHDNLVEDYATRVVRIEDGRVTSDVAKVEALSC
jgi:putative ABC transport system ATP-binding protein